MQQESTLNQSQTTQIQDKEKQVKEYELLIQKLQQDIREDKTQITNQSIENKQLGDKINELKLAVANSADKITALNEDIEKKAAHIQDIEAQNTDLQQQLDNAMKITLKQSKDAENQQKVFEELT